MYMIYLYIILMALVPDPGRIQQQQQQQLTSRKKLLEAADI